uniref:DIRP domain-containing protein n=1 Tax=Anopheles melas TaxID=34690 RepID=A0A182TXP0_9DIPT
MEDLLPHSAQGCSLDDCLKELEYDEVACYEAEASSSTTSKSCAVSNLVAEILERVEDDTKSSSEASSISCDNSPAKGAIFKRSKLSPHELQPKPASCHGNLKLYRFMMCEWFYSHIDSALFAEEHSRSVDFGTLLRQHYPALHRCPLQRPQWNHIRKEFGKVARFTIDGIDHEQLLPDYRVALDQSPPSAEQSDVLSVSAKHLRQVAALNDCVDEKRRLLYELENIRLNTEARRAMGRLNAERDQQQGQRYEQILRKLLDLNRTLLQLSKNVATEYEQNMSEPLTTSETPVVEAYVVEVVNQLIEDCSKLDQFHKNPEADRLWKEALERLGKNPEYLKQFEHYLAARIGNKFDPLAYRKHPEVACVLSPFAARSSSITICRLKPIDSSSTTSISVKRSVGSRVSGGSSSSCCIGSGPVEGGVVVVAGDGSAAVVVVVVVVVVAAAVLLLPLLPAPLVVALGRFGQRTLFLLRAASQPGTLGQIAFG